MTSLQGPRGQSLDAGGAFAQCDLAEDHTDTHQSLTVKVKEVKDSGCQGRRLATRLVQLCEVCTHRKGRETEGRAGLGHLLPSLQTQHYTRLKLLVLDRPERQLSRKTRKGPGATPK